MRLNRFNEYLNYTQIWVNHLNLGVRVRLCGLALPISRRRKDRKGGSLGIRWKTIFFLQRERKSTVHFGKIKKKSQWLHVLIRSGL